MRMFLLGAFVGGVIGAPAGFLLAALLIGSKAVAQEHKSQDDNIQPEAIRVARLTN
ncbi:hypothetical protein [Rhizobium sp. Leaf321]|uniref:hypothetical protein n=1 Tax=Rhizobium sp. Leaf321 TaxID=1736335 RepID=UPI000B0967DE|nr:hypothetical protein [Rhizobium sp. Leaf321]